MSLSPLPTLKLIAALGLILSLPCFAADPGEITNSAPIVPAPATNSAAETTPPAPTPPAEPSSPTPATNAAVETAPSITGTSVSSSTAPTASSVSKFTWSSVKVDGPYIAMTFDDGPNPKNTPKLLDLLAAKHIHATFFEVGENVVRMPDIEKRIIAEGHEIGNHSWDHPNFGKLSDDKIRSQIQRTGDAIFAESGVKPTLLRPPYGSMTPRQRQWVHDEMGYTIVLWDVDPNDWKEPGVNVVAERIISGTRPGSIILSHDIHAPTIEAMPQVFDALLAKGYKFVTVSELIAMNNPNLKPTPAPTKSATLASTEPSPTKPTPTPAKPKSSPPKPSAADSSSSSSASAPASTNSAPRGMPPLPVHTRP